MSQTRFAVVVLAALALPSLLHAQTARNAAFFELGGSAVVPSVNYERRLNERWYGRIGASYVSGETVSNGETIDRDTTFVIPLTISNVSRPASNHHLELGGGLTLAAGDRQDLYDIGSGDNFSRLFVTGIAGYRYQKPGGGFQFRAAFTPIAGGGDILPWVGLSFGYAW